MTTENSKIDGTQNIPLLVDLDGALIRTDTLFETTIIFLKENPLSFYLLFVWFLKGKQVLKRELARRTELNVDSLPVNNEVFQYLEQQHQNGRKIVLCTGSWFEIAEKIAQRFPFVDQIIATDDQRNLTGSVKAENATQLWGKHNYDYLGNEDKDMVVWKSARRALVVGDNDLGSAAGQVAEVEKHFIVDRVGIKTWVKAIRVHQWAKNGLLFVPLLVSQKFLQYDAVLEVMLAYISFCLCASATYLLNDLMDLESDRKHAIKKSRPLAAGLIAIPNAVVVIVLLLMIGLGLPLLLLNTAFFVALLCYLTLTILYSFRLKRLQTVDVIVLASLFTIRVVAGAVVIDVILSFWLLSFSMFMFLSLALVKRVSELIHVEKGSKKRSKKISGRGYFTADIVILQSLGGTAGFMSVLVFALYINSPEVVKLYRQPEVLWFMVPVIGYWIMRIWIITARGEMDEDPISYAIKNKNSWAVALITLLVLAIAITI